MRSTEPELSQLERNSRILTRNTAVLLSRYLALMALGSVMVLFLPRYLHDEGLGRLQFALSFVSLFTVGVALGTRQFLIKEIARDRTRVHTYLAAAMGLRLITGVIILGAILLVTWLRGAVGEAFAVILLAAVHMIAMSFAGLEAAVIQGHENMKWPALAEVANKVITVVAGIVVLVMGLGVIGYASVLLAGALVQLLLNVAYVGRRYGMPVTFDPLKLKGVFIGGAPFLLMVFLGGAYAHTDVVMLKFLTNDREVGWYAAATQIYKWMEFLPVALTTAMLPTLARLHATDVTTLLVLARRAIIICALGMVPMALGISLLSGEVIAFLPYPDAFQNSVPLLTILALTVPVTAILTIMGTIAMAVDRQMAWSVALLATVLLNAGLNGAAIPYFERANGNGAIGAAIATMFSEGFMFFVGVRLLPKGVWDKQVGGACLKVLFSGVVMILAGLVARAFGAGTILLVLIGVVVYGTMILYTKAVDVNDLRDWRDSLLTRFFLGKHTPSKQRAQQMARPSGEEHEAPADKNGRPENEERFMSTPELSIVIPTHNRQHMLKEMLLSIQDQSLASTQFEVLVVDDGSSDGTQEMLRDLQVSYVLRPLQQAQAGPAAARNHAAQLASGRVLLFLDDDLLPQRELFAEHLRGHLDDQPAVVLGHLLPVQGGTKPGWQVWEERIFANHYRALRSGRRPPAGRRLYSGNFSVGRAAFCATGGFDIQLQRGEDVELGLRLEQAGAQFSYNPAAAAIHRGVRSFNSWTNSAYLYGRCDVQLTTLRGHPNVFSEIFRWYFHQPPIARLAVSLCQSRSALRRAVLQGMRTTSGLLTALRLHSFAHGGYSGIYKLQYWQGVADELGGRAEFVRMAKLQRAATLTAPRTRTAEERATTVHSRGVS